MKLPKRVIEDHLIDKADGPTFIAAVGNEKPAL